MKFTKAEATQNDFILIREEDGGFSPTPGRVRALCDRHRGIGADGILLLSSSPVAVLRMRIFNADGSEAEMCGNGIRCAAAFAFLSGSIEKSDLSVETKAGIRNVSILSRAGNRCRAEVGMGHAEIGARVSVFSQFPRRQDKFFADATADLQKVSLGNPHAVLFVRKIHPATLTKAGGVLQKSPFFPRGVNLELVEVLSERELRVAVFERGCGVTPSCGTGACAAVSAAVYHGFCHADSPVAVHMPGGDLEITVSGDGDCLLCGDATLVFHGEETV